MARERNRRPTRGGNEKKEKNSLKFQDERSSRKQWEFEMTLESNHWLVCRLLLTRQSTQSEIEGETNLSF